LNPLYWIWLACVLGQGSRKFSDVLERFGSAENFYKATFEEMVFSGCFSRSQAQQIKSVGLDKAEKIYDECKRKGQKVITYQSEEYPELLRNIYSPPAVLYVKGNLPDMDNSVGIAIVGTRKCTSYGYEAAHLLGHRLSKAGVIIISGGAQGIDTAAHWGCLEAKGTNVAVLPCGIDTRYNMENIKLRERISETGALVSEYPPGAGVTRYNFHARNRLLSGLSRGTVVVEAGAKSGALITANHAAEQGKDIFAIPGNVQSPFSIGSNRLIKEGAFAVDCPADILSQYASLFPHLINMKNADAPLFGGSFVEPNTPSENKAQRSKDTYLKGNRDKIIKAEKPNENVAKVKEEKSQKQIALPEGLSAQSAKIMSVFGDTALTTDDIMEATGLSAGEILRGLTELEIFELIVSLPGGRYSKC